MNQVVTKPNVAIRELEPREGYERLVEARDEQTGLHALVSIHSLRRGPAAGGCRMFNYARIEDAIYDVERLSRGMTYKNAAADLPLGGGKSVIIGDPKTQKTPELMRAFGKLIECLAGDYYTAEDVGVSPQDMAYVAERTSYVAGLEGGEFASGDPSPVTARGVFLCLKQTLKHRLGSDDLTGKTVAVQGLGHVGMSLAGMLHAAGAKLIVSDINDAAVRAAEVDFGAMVVSPDDILRQDVDVFAPCAMGGALSADAIAVLKARFVVGAANNQLADDTCGQRMQDAGILYAPDYVVNGGGIVNVAMEILKVADPAYRESRIAGLAKTLEQVFVRADETGEPPHSVADKLIESRLR
ncbi:amino acid dehydrogenase [Defluviimonas sp. WL0024]|uniref:Amino acid dehydrogenase n=1 Tax=Albidovulum salinarum TaxID=2984153 RepID=A0ABT2WYK3_9RHOB|nr:Glu/Leu/Phe/Val dehydrogenase dimerization domain-containing protein [Defluviimonas sp. WL0024]MCU9846753.1 amino acid dehydrogenase [Defluviimonas sp. WL0024]